MADALNHIDLQMDQGDTLVTKWQIKDQGVSPATEVDIGGAVFWFTAKNDIDDLDAAAVFQKTELNGITIDDAAAGKITVEVVPADTATLTEFLDQEKDLVYDLQYKSQSGQIFTVARGRLKVKRQVTIATS